MGAASPQSDIAISRAGFLIVDPKPLAREMVQAALDCQARHVRQTLNVEMAIEILTQPTARVDCVVADWDMFPVGGLELLRMIRCRALPNVDPRMGFVVFTGRAQETAVKSAIELDVNGFVVAKLSRDKLARAIGSALRRDWLLQDVAHYASVPCVLPPAPPLEHRGRRPLPPGLRSLKHSPVAGLEPSTTRPTSGRAT